ncbi:MAG TPA: NHL repeat-containing protein, partial [Nitrososphaerales archaeon]|nr:NHL repeat-containing protein [Nitrososphaerales archaeon]
KAPERRKVGLILRSLTILSLLLVTSALIAPRALAFANGQNASVVIGQPNFTSQEKISPLVNSSRFSDPYDVKFDSSGNIWVVDSANSRILEFKPPFTNDEQASLVLGEPNFATSFSGGTTFINGSVLYVPQAIAFDSSGNLWVSDTGDSRIVEFTAPFSTGENASMVLGEPTLAIGSAGGTQPASQTDLNAPAGLAFDSSGNLWIADSGYDRVLEFKAPFTNGEAASVVLGQDNFTASDFPNEPNCPPTCNQPTAATLDGPNDVAFDASGNLWVADRGDHRVSEFTPPFSNGQAAALTVGGDCAIFGEELAANCMSVIDYITFDHSGMLWVSDTGNGRVLGFPSPFVSRENATVVLGEPDFATSPGIIDNATLSNLLSPEGIAFDSAGNLWVADDGLNRVLGFPASAAGSTSTTSTTIQSSTTPIAVSSTTSIQQTTTPQLSTTSASMQSTSSPTSSSGDVPEFPFQIVAMTTVAVLLVGAYLLVRRHAGSQFPTGRGVSA